MHHGTPLISTIVAGLVLAYIFGMIANRLRLPPLVGYLFAGVLVGPHTPGFVADQALGAELAELGVILLMFGVGLHFSLKDLMSVRALAIPGAIAQIAVATALGAGLGTLLGWPIGGSLLFGLALSVASTVVLLKALQDRRLIESERGRIAVGWLIVEDLAMVLALVLVPAIASLNGVDTGVHDPFVSFVERIVNAPVGIWGVLIITLVKVAAFVGFMLIVGRRLIPWALHLTAHTGSRELFRLAVLAIALGVALGSAVLFGVSLALGAFFAGMILSESELSHRAANETLPLRDAFAVLFFVSVGMLFDPTIIITNPLPVLATVFIIVVGKSIAAFGIVLLFRRPVGTALTISASLAQIGEFSFILASMGVSLAILPQEGQDLILAGALISIVLNPIVFFLLERMRPKLETRYGRPVAAAAAAGDGRVEPGEFATVSQGPATSDIPREAGIERGALGADDDLTEPLTLSGHAVLVGYGQVGRIVADGLKTSGRDVVVIEDSDHDVAAARVAGLEVIYGNAASQDVLKLANLGGAKNLLVAISNAFEAGSVVESGRKLNPEISIVARAYSEEEETFLRGLGASVVIRGEREIGKGILALLQAGEDKPAPVTPEPDEPKLPPTENIVAQAAGMALAVSPIAEVVEIVRPEATEVEVLYAPTVIELPPPAVKEPEAPVVPPAEVVEIEAETDEPAEVAGRDETPSIGEPPAAIDEVVVVAPESAEPVEPAAPAVEKAVVPEPVVEVETPTLVASDLPVVGPVEPVIAVTPAAPVEPVLAEEPAADVVAEPAFEEAPKPSQTVAENGENGDSGAEKPAATDDEPDADAANTETPGIPVVKPEPRD
ncbi:cation:proton antiporter [Devosia sp. BK]|nr:cation:proton antiporter [Devosia sp. BK]